jgi:Uma2 family endonuclease
MRRPPDIAIEILPPGQNLREMRAKVDLYRDFGVRSVWVIDPETRSVDVYEGGARRTTQAGEALTTAVIPALQLSVAALFDRAHKPPPGEPAG